ncbi:MAG: 16S rRNA (uracil(1498)-N(3))-methyltransferase [Magnetococcales bacterium]|nr:16S rRNA (uracil(1498)-N(3))-methyltransferase [Magnetococcales bacterium]
MVPRIYFPGQLDSASEVVLPPEPTRYLQGVLRLRSGAEVVLFNGNGGEWTGRLQEDNRRLKVRQLVWRTGVAEPALRLTLVQGLAKAAAMEWIIQKGVELGLSRLLPLLCERSFSRGNARGFDAIPERWHRIAQEAAEQCRRTRLPELAPPVTPARLGESLPPGPRLLFWEEQREQPGLRSLLSDETFAASCRESGHLTLLVGPEGGLTADEAHQAVETLGFVTVGLGPRILRCETAAVSALALVGGLWGDLA